MADKPPISPLLVNASDAAAMLGMSKSHLYILIAGGKVIRPIKKYGKSLWSVEALADMVRKEVEKQGM